MTEIPERVIFTRPEAADYLSVSINTLDRLVESKQLAAFKITNPGHRRPMVRISRDECDEFLARASTRKRGPGRPRKAG